MRIAVTIGCILAMPLAVYSHADDQFDSFIGIGLFAPNLPTSLAPDPDELIAQCTQRLTEETEIHRRIQLLSAKSEAHLVLRQFPQAAETIALARELDPNDTRVMLICAKVSANAGMIAEATMLCDSLLKREPANLSALTFRAHISCQALNDPESAISDATAAISIDPNDARSYLVRSLAKAKTKSYEDALKDINTYLLLVGTGPPGQKAIPFILKGQILMAGQRFEEALPVLDLALQLDAETYAAAECLWRCYRELDKNVLSILAAEKMLRIDPKNNKSHRAAAISYFEAEEIMKAMPHLEAWHTNDPADPSPAGLIAAAHFASGSYEKAKNAYDHAILTYPSSIGTRLGRALFLTTCPDKAILDFDQALSDIAFVKQSEVLLSDKALRLTAIVQYNAGRKDEAIVSLRKRATMHPTLSEKEAEVFRQLTEAMESGTALRIAVPSFTRIAAEASATN